MLGRRTAEQKQQGQSAWGVPPLGIVSLPTAAQDHQSPTIFVISGKLRAGIPLSIVRALGFTEASSFLTKVSGVKHPAQGGHSH